MSAALVPPGQLLRHVWSEMAVSGVAPQKGDIAREVLQNRPEGRGPVPVATQGGGGPRWVRNIGPRGVRPPGRYVEVP